MIGRTSPRLKGRDRLRRLPYLGTAISLVAALAAFVIGVRHGTFAASDTDPYGYVSQAEVIAGGALRVDQRDALSMPWLEADLSFVPAGYTRAPVEGFIVPTYPVGLPVVMAAFLRVTGQRDAVFYVVPLMGALLVWATARLGTRLHSTGVGAAAALLLVASPIFLLQVTQPVSDVPAAAWWAVSLLLTLRTTRWTAAVAGGAASMAILTRPNLVPLAAVLGVYYLWHVARGNRPVRRDAATRLVLFCLATLPGCLAVAAINNYLYGSPLSSGYAPFHELYQWKHVPFNLDRYPRWLLQTQTPLIYLGLAAPFVARDRARIWLLFGFAAVVVLSYIPYGYFGYDDWGYLRFLLPAYPVFFVTSLLVGHALLSRVVSRKPLLPAVAIACVLALAAWQIRLVNRYGAVTLHEGEQRYVFVGRYTARAMPSDAVFFAGLHSGSIRYYSGKPTINFNNLHPRALEEAVSALLAMGRRPFIVIEDGEEAQFKWRFDTYTGLGKLDWPPSVQTRRGGVVSIYDPAERMRFMAGMGGATFDMDMRTKETVKEK